MKKFLNITCKQATYLLSKKEEGKLTWLDKWRLSRHLVICYVCELFEIQTNFITKHAHDYVADASMPESSKQQIKEQLQQLS
ncbi:MAG: hypothetical protein ACOVNY_09040 [Chitinophagaceae bacterium]|jgi:hypothetical protein